MAALKAELEKLLPRGLSKDQMATAAKTHLLLQKKELCYAYDEKQQRARDITEAFAWGGWVGAGHDETIQNNLIWLIQIVGLMINETKVSRKKANNGQAVKKECGELCTEIADAASAKWFDTNILPHSNITRPGHECYVHGLCGGEDILCDIGGFGARPPPARRPPPSHSHARARPGGAGTTRECEGGCKKRMHHFCGLGLTTAPVRRCQPAAAHRPPAATPRLAALAGLARSRACAARPPARRHAWPRRPAPAHPPAHARAGRARCRAIGAYASAAAQRMRPRATSRRRASSSSSSPWQADRG